MELLGLEPVQADLVHLGLELLHLLAAAPLHFLLLAEVSQLQGGVVDINKQCHYRPEMQLSLCLELAILSKEGV